MRAVRSPFHRLATRLGTSCLLAGLLVAGLPAPAALLALPGTAPSRGACEETPAEDPMGSPEEGPGAKLGHLGAAHGRSPRFHRSDQHRLPDAIWPPGASSASHRRLARPVRGVHGGGGAGHFLAEGRLFRQWVQSHLC